MKHTLNKFICAGALALLAIPGVSYSQTPTPSGTSATSTVMFPASPTAGAVPTSVIAAGSGPLVGFGGLEAVFPRDEQVLSETSIEIHGVVTAQVTVPTKLFVLSAPVGSPLGNQLPLFNATMNPGDSKDITVTLTGLTAGQQYYFALKNASTNSMSSPLYFTTPGGAFNETARFAGQRVGGNEAPPTVTIQDDISDQGIVPKCGRTAGPNVAANEVRMCTYKDFLQLVANIINFIFIILGPIIAIYLIYLGAMIIFYGSAADPTEEIMKKLRAFKTRLLSIAIGIFIILIAWTIIATILIELGVKPNYILLDIFSG